MRTGRDPTKTLSACDRILVLGRTGSGKTTLARQLAAELQVPHVELDALYFGPGFSTAPLSLLRERTTAAIAGERWVIDGNKRAVRDLVWPRADTIVWLDYPLGVSLWRLAKRARRRTAALKADTGSQTGLPRAVLAAAKGVLTALRSHAGQRREYPRLFAEPANQHLAVVRLRSPRAARRWLEQAASNPSGDHHASSPLRERATASPSDDHHPSSPLRERATASPSDDHHPSSPLRQTTT